MAFKKFSILGATSVLRTSGKELFASNGAELLKAAAKLAEHQKACVLVVNDEKFNTSSYGYQSRAVLVNSTEITVPPEAIMVGTELGRMKTPYVLIKPGYTNAFLQSRVA